jgi:hypothetical protein
LHLKDTKYALAQPQRLNDILTWLRPHAAVNGACQTAGIRGLEGEPLQELLLLTQATGTPPHNPPPDPLLEGQLLLGEQHQEAAEIPASAKSWSGALWQCCEAALASRTVFERAVPMRSACQKLKLHTHTSFRAT